MPAKFHLAPFLSRLIASLSLLFFTLPGSAAPHPAAPAHAAKTVPQPSPLAWLPPAAVTQRNVFDYLASRMGEVPPDPQPPDTGIVAWALARYRTAADQPNVRYALVYQDLSLAKQRLVWSCLT